MPTGGPLVMRSTGSDHVTGLRPMAIDRRRVGRALVNSWRPMRPGCHAGLVPVIALCCVVIGDVRAPMLYLFIAVAMVLLIASANVANLLLMRAEARRGELALRVALGAARGRIVTEVLIESVILALVAGVAGLVLAEWSLGAFVSLAPDGLPRVESVRIDGTVMAFSVGVVLVTALLAGLAPALLSARAELMSHLRGASWSHRPRRWHPWTPNTRRHSNRAGRHRARRRRSIDSECPPLADGRSWSFGEPAGPGGTPRSPRATRGPTSARGVSRSDHRTPPISAAISAATP